MATRMRYSEQALEELKRADPDTPISLNFIRTLAATGKIPIVMVGRRRLINFDALLDYLANPPAEEPAAPGRGVIRRVL